MLSASNSLHLGVIVWRWPGTLVTAQLPPLWPWWKQTLLTDRHSCGGNDCLLRQSCMINGVFTHVASKTLAPFVEGIGGIGWLTGSCLYYITLWYIGHWLIDWLDWLIYWYINLWSGLSLTWGITPYAVRSIALNSITDNWQFNWFIYLLWSCKLL